MDAFFTQKFELKLHKHFLQCSKLRREDGSYSLPPMVNSNRNYEVRQIYSFSSSIGISSMFFSLLLLTKNSCNNLTSRYVFCAVLLFSCSEIKSSTEPALTNLEAILVF